mgnify:CR=1 FL=1
MANLESIGGLHYEMMKRCYNENSVAFKSYGRKGIKVCEEWHDREVFRKWALENNVTHYTHYFFPLSNISLPPVFNFDRFIPLGIEAIYESNLRVSLKSNGTFTDKNGINKHFILRKKQHLVVVQMIL